MDKKQLDTLITEGQPFGKVRTLRNEIFHLKYELSLFDQGIKKRGRKKIEGCIAQKKSDIKQILEAVKLKNQHYRGKV